MELFGVAVSQLVVGVILGIVFKNPVVAALQAVVADVVAVKTAVASLFTTVKSDVVTAGNAVKSQL